MKLRLPEQNAPAADATPNNPRKLKKVLSELPNSNMGELTRQTFIILRDLNRQTMPNKHRLENLEMIRDLTREIFNNLKKYFINRTLPLPEKSQKIVRATLEMLGEPTLQNWLQLDMTKLTAEIIAMPTRDDVMMPVEAQMIVELCSQ